MHPNQSVQVLIHEAAMPRVGSPEEQNLRLRKCPPSTICARLDRPVNGTTLPQNVIT